MDERLELYLAQLRKTGAFSQEAKANGPARAWEPDEYQTAAELHAALRDAIASSPSSQLLFIGHYYVVRPLWQNLDVDRVGEILDELMQGSKIRIRCVPSVPSRFELYVH